MAIHNGNYRNTSERKFWEQNQRETNYVIPRAQIHTRNGRPHQEFNNREYDVDMQSNVNSSPYRTQNMSSRRLPRYNSYSTDTDNHGFYTQSNSNFGQQYDPQHELWNSRYCG